MEITNNFKKMVASLGTSKGRREEKCFIAEGTKCVMDTIKHFSCRYLLATAQWIEKNGHELSGVNPIAVRRADMERMTQLTTPTDVIAVYEIPQTELDDSDLGQELTIVLDRVQDPGNLGTIIRIADWFGIHQIIASYDTVDVFNPKTIQATMGAISRVKVIYTDLKALIESQSNLPIYGTLLEGENIYEKSLKSPGIIIMGNEGKGITPSIRELISEGLFIPSYPGDVETSESLNVGVATAITIAEFRRQEMVNKNVK